jgi:hypothetical protein
MGNLRWSRFLGHLRFCSYDEIGNDGDHFVTFELKSASLGVGSFFVFSGATSEVALSLVQIFEDNEFLSCGQV